MSLLINSKVFQKLNLKDNKMIDIFEKLKDTANQLNFLKQNLVKNFKNNPALN